ncbi:MAG: hypothetical protein G01um101425_185 [Candidatus Peregrinibacteria bacterium Gr01-1014_25]|nr:MAG: hypothetical protein G01um101425_185 [Candidatus Peregrinibacteria bacterium Gr01-1014_25]
MHIHLSLRRAALAVVVAAAVPAAVLAMPAPVSGIVAQRVDVGVHVSWKAVPNAHRYHVYFSRTSILEGGGLYDDVEVTEGPAPEHLLKGEFATQGPLWIAVLAEDADGATSGIFIEEAHIPGEKSAPSADGPTLALPEQEKPDAAEASAASSDGRSETLRMLMAETPSATQVRLTFSHPVVLDEADAEHAFVITDAFGKITWIQRLFIDREIVTLDTEPLRDGVAYAVTADKIRGLKIDPAGDTMLPLDAAARKTLFTGPTSTSNEAGDVRNAALRALPQMDGSLLVEISWEMPSGTQPVGYILSQSIDGGRTFAREWPVPASTNGARIRGVDPTSAFALRISAVGADNAVSRGVIVTLPGVNVIERPAPEPKPPVHAPVAAVVPATKIPAAALPSSGGVAVSMLVAGGALAAAMSMRRRRRVLSVSRTFA